MSIKWYFLKALIVTLPLNIKSQLWWCLTIQLVFFNFPGRNSLWRHILRSEKQTTNSSLNEIRFFWRKILHYMSISWKIEIRQYKRKIIFQISYQYVQTLTCNGRKIGVLTLNSFVSIKKKLVKWGDENQFVGFS